MERQQPRGQRLATADSRLSTLAPRALLGALLTAGAIALALLAGTEHTARWRTHLGTLQRAHGVDLAVAAATLESAARLGPGRPDAALERARVALLQGDPATAWVWLERCRGRVASRLRWDQMAANALRALGRPAEAETALSEALALHPGAPASDWEGLAELREETGRGAWRVEAARVRAESIRN